MTVLAGQDLNMIVALLFSRGIYNGGFVIIFKESNKLTLVGKMKTAFDNYIPVKDKLPSDDKEVLVLCISSTYDSEFHKGKHDDQVGWLIKVDKGYVREEDLYLRVVSWSYCENEIEWIPLSLGQPPEHSGLYLVTVEHGGARSIHTADYSKDFGWNYSVFGNKIVAYASVSPYLD